MTHDDRGVPTAPRWLSGVTLIGVLAACGGTAQPAGPGPAASPVPPAGTASPTSTPAAATQLTVVYRRGGDESTTWQLRCSPAGGTHPDPPAACAVLDDNGRAALGPVDPSTMCAQVYTGPETATIKGTWRGRDIRSSLNLTNACETARWKALVGLLPPIRN